MAELWPVYAIIGLALVFDYVNGFHDAANSIATIVSTRVLAPQWAVVWAAVFNFIAFLFFGLHVAKTIGKGVVDPNSATIPVIAAGLIGAINWNLITWWSGIPSSSSHALVGGFAGAAVAYAGPGILVVGGLVKTGIFIILAPLLGFAIGFIFMVITYWIFHRSSPARVGGLFRKLQLVSAAAYSLGHGGNDAQKTMGIIFAVQIAAGLVAETASEPAFWTVVIPCHVAMGLGTLAGGWRIVKTMGQKICDLQPVHGFSAETAGAVCLYGATLFGIPVSTTHTITGSIMGVGATRGIHAVKWGVAGRVIWAWVLTIPASAGVAALMMFLFNVSGWVRADQEGSVALSMKALAAAQEKFRAGDLDGNGRADYWTADVRGLGTRELKDGKGKAVPLLKKAIAEADAAAPKPAPFRGHFFKSLRRSQDGSGFAILAYPGNPRDGRYLALVREDGAVWRKPFDPEQNLPDQIPDTSPDSGWIRLD